MSEIIVRARVERARPLGWVVVAAEMHTPEGGTEWGTVTRRWFLTRRRADQRAALLRDLWRYANRDLHVRAGAAITGRAAARIIVDNASVLPKGWLEEVVRPRLYPGGEIVLRYES